MQRSGSTDNGSQHLSRIGCVCYEDDVDRERERERETVLVIRSVN